MQDHTAKASFARQGYAIAIILMHLALSIAHGLAHNHLAIDLTIAQKTFVGVVIVVAPLVAGYLIWKHRLRLGGALMAISMAGALTFGVYYHFIAPGPDNINQSDPTAPANWRNLFEDTAIDLALIEALGVLAGVVFVKSAPQKVTEETRG
jgi:hypothetical protein